MKRFNGKRKRPPYDSPTVADLLGISPQRVDEIVEGMAALERQRRVAQALVTHERRAAQTYRQRMIDAGRLKPAQESA
jgi:ABC-type polar amino acid transport system ATPase subunit